MGWIDERIKNLKFKWKDIHIKIHHKGTVEYYRLRGNLKSRQSWAGMECAD